MAYCGGSCSCGGPRNNPTAVVSAGRKGTTQVMKEQGSILEDVLKKLLLVRKPSFNCDLRMDEAYDDTLVGIRQ